MAKIKFNLNFGGEQIRTLDDLCENFSIEDVLDVYNNGMLVKWLDVRNYKSELEQVKSIQATDARSILTELIKIFDISDDPSEIQDSLSVLDYLEERKKVHEDMRAHGITDYEKIRKERDELSKQVEELKKIQYTQTPEETSGPETQKLQRIVKQLVTLYDSIPETEPVAGCREIAVLTQYFPASYPYNSPKVYDNPMLEKVLSALRMYVDTNIGRFKTNEKWYNAIEEALAFYAVAVKAVSIDDAIKSGKSFIEAYEKSDELVEAKASDMAKEYDSLGYHYPTTEDHENAKKAAQKALKKFKNLDETVKHSTEYVQKVVTLINME